MKILDDMKSCYGCGACRSICPTRAIHMKANAEGFLEPTIDNDRCISCGRCKQVCPSLNCQYPNDPKPDIFAFSAEEKVLYNSSSGGIFTFLAEHILRAGGYVIGAAFDPQFYVNHTVIHSAEDLDKIRRSKYLQSATGDTFQAAKDLLKKGEYVLYSGCPCQIAGLLRFLGRDYEKLYTVDVLCHGVPSSKLFREHLRNSFGSLENIADVEFRSREGWASLFKVTLKNGDVQTLYNNNSIYMESFLQDINLRASCFRCQYSRVPRQGDITIGDLWAASNFNLSIEYKKGVSVVLLNNAKGEKLFQAALSESGHKFQEQKLYGKDIEAPYNMALLNDNIFHPSTSKSSADRRQIFFENCLKMSFEKAAYTSLHKFDVGLMLHMSNNYGSIATNYALYKTICDTGRKAAVLDNMNPLYGEAAAFARKHMNLCSGFMAKDDCRAANQCFETFIVGSDITWEWNFKSWSRLSKFWMLGFAGEDKRLISYAPSFGWKNGKVGSTLDEDIRAVVTHCLNRFEAVSVREDYGIDICRDLFGVQAVQVVDPVLLCDRNVWDELSAMSQLKFNEEYLLAYILDPTPYKRQVILEAAKNLNIKPVVILDLEVNIEHNKKVMNLEGNIVRPGFIDWIAYFKNASYVITDSMHGTCFSILFQKKFVSIKNRSKDRFDSLANLIDCPSLFFEDSRSLLGKSDIFVDIDYDSIYKHIELKRMESERWLHSALMAEVKPKKDSDLAPLMWKMFEALREKTPLLNKIRRDYAYEEEQKKGINAQLKAGKTWFEIVSSKNNIVLENSKLRTLGVLKDYFSLLKADPKYVVVLSCRDECSNYRQKFIEISGLPLRTDVTWRNSYVAVIDEGRVQIDEKSTEEINVDYEFVSGHPNYSVEYLDGQFKVCCKPLRYCKIKIKSKGYTEPSGADNSAIMVDNIDYSMNKIGINMVVIDKETGKVVDSVNINTYADTELRINRV